MKEIIFQTEWQNRKYEGEGYNNYPLVKPAKKITMAHCDGFFWVLFKMWQKMFCVQLYKQLILHLLQTSAEVWQMNKKPE